MSKIAVFRSWNSVLNIHERRLPATAAEVGALLDTLHTPGNLLWPDEKWPASTMDKGLTVGATGGHAVIRYRVAEYIPGRRVEYAFGSIALLPVFRGRHYFEVIPRAGETVLRHTIDVQTVPGTWFRWKVMVECLHDALLEDLFDKAERNLGVARPHRSRWSWYVRLMVWVRKRHRRAR